MKHIYITLLLIACMSNWLLGQTLVNNLQSGSTSCPLMEVEMVPSTDLNLYTINYCNHGNALATNVYVDIELAPDFYIAEAPYPSTYIAENLYRIHLLNVQPSKCEKFDIKIGSNKPTASHCTKVYIYPNNPCQAMIDRYMETHSEDINAAGGDNSSSNIIVLNQNNTERTRVNIGLLGSVNSIFEDNVMLNNVPIWDSLLHIFNNNNAGQSTTNDNTIVNSTQNGKGEAGGNDNNSQNPSFSINELFWAEHCNEITATNPTSITTVSQIDAIEEELVSIADENPNFSESAGSQKDPSTSLGQNDVKNISVSVFPNPFKDQATVRLSGMDIQNTALVLVDITGRTLQTIQFQSQEIVLQKENLAAGLYFYQIVKDEKVEHIGKVVIR